MLKRFLKAEKQFRTDHSAYRNVDFRLVDSKPTDLANQRREIDLLRECLTKKLRNLGSDQDRKIFRNPRPHHLILLGNPGLETFREKLFTYV